LGRAEALLFGVEQNVRQDVPRSQTTVEFGAVVAHASLILIVGNGRSPVYEFPQVQRVMQERFRRAATEVGCSTITRIVEDVPTPVSP